MSSENILKQFQAKIQKLCEIDLKKLEKEKDEIKQIQIQKRIQKITLSVLLKGIKKMSDKEWHEFFDQIFEPEAANLEAVFEQVDKLAYKTAKNIKDYKKYEKIKKINFNANYEISKIVGTVNRNKKLLKRWLEFTNAIIGSVTIAGIQTNLTWYEFLEAENIVQRRLGFDHNWLVCLSLIQLHENLIKKKLSELGGQIQKDEPIYVSIANLSKLIKEKENRDVSFTLLLANSIKLIRDTMTHEGYKHSISKPALGKLFEEIKDLEIVLYSEENTDKN